MPSVLLPDLLQQASVSRPDDLLFRFLVGGELENPVEMRVGELYARACRVAGRLHEVCARGDRVVLLFQPGMDFAVGLYACILGGFVAVPAYPPDPARLSRSLGRLQVIASDCDAAAVLTSAGVRAKAAELIQELSLKHLPWVDLDEGTDWSPQPWAAEEIALLQYTSGSTGNPRGVAIDHGNLIHNLAQLHHCLPDCSVMLWAPFFHDMGLILGHLGPLVMGHPCTMMEPLHFLQRPLRWLRAVEHFQCDATVAPVFGLGLLHRKITDAQLDALDLSGIRRFVVSAEPARPEVLTAFADRFERAGLRRDALRLGYGLAESTLVTTCTEGFPRFETVVGSDPVTILPSSGKPLDADVRILDADRQPCAPGVIGEITVASESVASGYWKQESSKHFPIIDGRTFLRTGDLGFLCEGELYVTGRSKDLIIVRGRNLYPQDVEAIAEQAHPAIRPGCVAAFSLPTPEGERLAVAAEVSTSEDLPAVRTAILRALTQGLAATAESVVLLKKGTLPKTSSGKLRRTATREMLLAGTLTVVQAAPEQEHEIWKGEASLIYRMVAEKAGVPRSQVTDSTQLADLGLDSVKKAELFTEVSEALGRRLTENWFFRDVTMAALAAQCMTGQDSHVIPMNSHRTGAPFFFMHGMAGWVAHVGKLTARLDQPCYGIEPIDYHQRDFPDRSVEQVADRYIEYIEKFAPEGPIMLGGSSFGGVLALEMAQRLSARGRRPAMVLLIDTLAPRSVGKPDTLGMARLRLRDARRTVKVTRAYLRARVIGALKNRRTPRPRHLTPGRSAMQAAYVNYRAVPYTGHVVMVRTVSQDTYPFTWDGLLKDLRVLESTGEHLECLRRPHIETWIEPLRQAITEALAAPGAPSGVSRGTG